MGEKRLRNLTSGRFLRFLIVGTGNTIVNFFVLNILVLRFNQNIIVSSIAATTIAIFVSFILNRSYVFVDKKNPVSKFLRFSVVAALSTLLIQTSSYALSYSLLQHILSSGVLTINISNLIASIIVMLWNYNGYRIFVFTDVDSGDVKGHK